MEKIFADSSAVLVEVRQLFAQLESSRNEDDGRAFAESVQHKMSTIRMNCDRLESMYMREPPNTRQMKRYRIDQLKVDAQNLEVALKSLQSNMNRKWRANKDREELLTQRFRPNSEVSLSLGDHELQMNDRLQSSHNSIDNLISQGSAVLESLRSQHMNLKGVRRRMMDVGAALGLSNTTLTFIDRRTKEDWIIFVVGCILCIIFMFLFYRYWKGFSSVH